MEIIGVRKRVESVGGGGLTTRARYCWCELPCLSFFRMARDASVGLENTNYH